MGCQEYEGLGCKGGRRKRSEEGKKVRGWDTWRMKTVNLRRGKVDEGEVREGRREAWEWN